MPPAGSGYTFADFLQRLERSPIAHMSPLYHEHRLLFVNRPDMLSRAVLSISWERGVALMDAAYYTQPVAVETYRALLARMLRHNRHVEKSGAGKLVSWQAAMKVMNEAVLTHGTSLPTRVTVSTLRLLAPHRQWKTAIDLLKLSQANGQLTKPMLLDAAHACATSTAWPEALKLLMHLHKQEPPLLRDAIQSMRPPGSTAFTSFTAAQALLPPTQDSPAGPTPAQQHILEVLNSVVGSVPHQVALHDPLCSSYLTHLLASTTLSAELKVKRATSALARLPWTVALQLLSDVSEPVLLTDAEWQRVQETALLAGQGNRRLAKAARSGKRRKGKGLKEKNTNCADSVTREDVDEADAAVRGAAEGDTARGGRRSEAVSDDTASASATTAITPATTALFSRLQLLRTSPLTCAAMIAVMIDKLPTPEMAVSFIRCCAAQLAQSSTAPSPASPLHLNADVGPAGEAAALPSASAAGSVAATRHPVVVCALLRNCARHDTGWSIAANVLLEHSGAQVPTPTELLSTIVHQLRQAKKVSLVVRLLHQHVIPSGSLLTARAWEDVLECALAHNRVLQLRSAEGNAKTDGSDEHVLRYSGNSVTRRQPHRGSALSASGLSGVHWVSALSWVLDRQAPPHEARIVKTGTGPSPGAIPRHPTAHERLEQPLTPKMLSLLINICVQGGSPQGALHAMSYARRVDKMELPHTAQIRALLFCVQHNRPLEAEAIVAQLAKKEGEEAAQPLQHLLRIVGERQQGNESS
ncbi:hypothetical protein ABB37_04376 [Leptomonas pyrrhocoris]|uniref:Uncharacterized protein n=1 Tax=Leptomonas pyrrhocoris TaxID=157538 RepID=A0A0N0VFF1_LEPPY|nr:hypothetical protein ABB37_04376 [Leptomonas pyrrhocoris]KPA80994.1 hypothetical protein ABB37_04376 [Leptomonas pyrrhocoris]|eukprot:XP_015659433.1 hypothetical protein ABB37_04376 [Leptomonas pyrrhocoris]